MEAKTLKKHSLQQKLIDLIKKEVPLHSIYVISAYQEKKRQKIYLSPKRTGSQKTIAYTLLIITYKPISRGLGNFMDNLYNKMEQQCKVYAIVYTLSNVKKRLSYGDNFLTRIINQTTCIYKEDNTLSKYNTFKLCIHPFVFNPIQAEWNCRMERASYLLSIVDVIDDKEEPTSKLAIMHHALEQVCIALLCIFWEFKPNYYALPYLMHLCSHFTELPQTVFPKKTYGLQRMFYMLSNAHHIIRFKNSNEFTDRDADKAHNRCEEFYQEAKQLGERQLEYLKELHCQTAVLQ